MRLSIVIARMVIFVALGSTAFGGDPTWLAGLDPSKPASLCGAQKRFLARFPITSPNQAQGLFELWDFYGASISANQGAFNPLDEGLIGDQYFEVTAALRTGKRTAIDAMFARIPRVKQRMAPYLACGYSIVVDFDDTIMLDSSPVFLRAIQDRIQPGLWTYVQLYLTQNPYWLEYDGGLAIPLDRLRSRIRRWEKLRNENSSILPLTSHIDWALHLMFELYLCGLPNSLPFDDYGRMTDDARASYEQFLRLNTGSREYQLVASALANVKKHDWRLNQELIQLYDAHGYSTGYLKTELDRLHQ
jgi:hypothetical protein